MSRWMVAGLILLLTGVLPAQEQSDRVATLMDQLASDDIARRTDAVAELIKIGKPALAKLGAYLKTPLKAEGKLRAQYLIRIIKWNIRRAKYKPGKTMGGFQARLIPLQDEFKPGKGIPFRLEIQNVDKEDKTFVPLRRLDIDSPTGGAFSTEAHGGLTIKMIRGEKPKRTTLSAACGTAPDKSSVLLRSKEIWSKDLDLAKRGITKPGVYEIRIVYYCASRRLLERELAGDLISNTVRFEVKP